VNLELIPATPEQEPILANLLELYVHDFSEILELDLGDDGRFGYRNLSAYWTKPDHHPFLVRMDGKLAGFVLVKRGSEITGNPAVWDVAEFFVVRRYRRHGVGIQVAHELWRKLPGPWEVRVMQANVSAYSFWVRAISKFTGEAADPVPAEKDGENWNLFAFESKPAPQGPQTTE
jgi:predicted acetyltransferase